MTYCSMSNQLILYHDIYGGVHPVIAEAQEISYPIKAAHELDPAVFVSTYIYRICLAVSSNDNWTLNHTVINCISCDRIVY